MGRRRKKNHEIILIKFVQTQFFNSKTSWPVPLQPDWSPNRSVSQNQSWSLPNRPQLYTPRIIFYYKRLAWRSWTLLPRSNRSSPMFPRGTYRSDRRTFSPPLWRLPFGLRYWLDLIYNRLMRTPACVVLCVSSLRPSILVCVRSSSYYIYRRLVKHRLNFCNKIWLLNGIAPVPRCPTIVVLSECHLWLLSVSRKNLHPPWDQKAAIERSFFQFLLFRQIIQWVYSQNRTILMIIKFIPQLVLNIISLQLVINETIQLWNYQNNI